MRPPRSLVLILLALVLATLPAGPVAAAEIGLFAFQRTWARTDEPVAQHQAQRTWVWGPEAASPLLIEPYAEGSVGDVAGERVVQYFDKARMEVTDGAADPTDPWYVTNGLLARELITGQMQIGADTTLDLAPAEVNIAGDPDDPAAPTYASLRAAMGYAPIPVGWRITQTIDRAGHVGHDPALAAHDVTAVRLVPETNHTVASVFWDFMNSTGRIADGWVTTDGRLFESPFFATGFPITEPYWTTVKVGGEPTLVLVQAFERRVLTYTPGNPDGWKVEAGNVGQHYYTWRYRYQGEDPLRVQGLTYRRDISGNWVFVGEVRNLAYGSYAGVVVTVTQYNRVGEPISQQSGYLDLPVLAGGASLPFRVWFDHGQSFARVEVEVDGRPSERTTPPRLTVAAPSGDFDRGRAEVSGKISNDTAAPVQYVSYVVALYDRRGQVVGYDWGFATPATLAPGESATFRASFFNPPAAAVTYAVFATGM